MAKGFLKECCMLRNCAKLNPAALQIYFSSSPVEKVNISTLRLLPSSVIFDSTYQSISKFETRFIVFSVLCVQDSHIRMQSPVHQERNAESDRDSFGTKILWKRSRFEETKVSKQNSWHSMLVNYSLAFWFISLFQWKNKCWTSPLD